MATLRKATRQKTKLRVGLAGPAGSGKTYSALLLASGMADWSKIALIDTENGRGDLYAHLGGYNVLTLVAPFTPERYIAAIAECEKAGMEVIIIDSISHEWEGKGGCLESNEIVAQTRCKGNTWAAWRFTTPRHQNFLQAILTSSCHVITTARSKTKTEMDEVTKKVKKLGLEPITRGGFDYEVTLHFCLEREGHYAIADKDNTEMYLDKDPIVITPEVGKAIKEWCEMGVEPISPPVEPIEVVEKPVEEKKPVLDVSPPAFEDEVDHVNAFKTAFDRLAKSKKWKADIKKQNLEAITKGKKPEEMPVTILKQYTAHLMGKIA